MQDDTIIYVRNRKKTPVGVTYFQLIPSAGNSKVIAMGWSKAYKSDTFTKKFGKEIATKRAEKVCKWVDSQTEVAPMTISDLEGVDTLPFIIKKNISYYLDTAKENLGVEGDAIIVLPVVEKFVDVADAFKHAIANDTHIIDPSKGKTKVQTRYITIQH